MQSPYSSSVEPSGYTLLKPDYQNPKEYVMHPKPVEALNHIDSWPLDPKILNSSTITWLSRVMPHFSLLTIPICLIGLGIALLNLDNRAVSSTGDTVLQTMAVTATLWPILFASVVGPMVKSTALYRAQKGAKLGIIEIISTSQTFISTVRTCATIRIFSLWPLVLLSIWALSPAGGQGALRAMGTQRNTTIHGYPLITYPVNNFSVYGSSTFNSGASGGASLINNFKAIVGAVFTAQDMGLLHANGTSHGFDKSIERVGGLDQAIELCKRDMWRNIRIPFMHLLPGYQASSKYEWVYVPENAIPEYSSLIGVPSRGIPLDKNGNMSYLIQSNYQVLKCKPQWINYRTWLQENNGSQLIGPFPSAPMAASGSPNLYWDIIKEGHGRYEPTMDTSHSTALKRPTKLMFYTMNNVTFCETVTEYVETSVRCQRMTIGGELKCSVTKMRNIPGFDDLRNVTALKVGGHSQVLKQIPYTMASSHPSEAGILEKWLKNPPTAFQGYDPLLKGWYQGFEDVPMVVLQNRLAMILNTFNLATLDMENIVGSDGLSLTNRNANWGNTTGSWSEYTSPVYHLRRAWFLLYFASAFVLLACAVANIVLRILIRVPDFLGNVSALTRDSLFMDVPTPASTLDGTERSRLLQHKWVMIQDVRPGNEVGRIAFSDAPAMVPLRKDRLYM